MSHGIPIALILTTFNSENFLEDSIKSVFSQKLLPNEFIIIDNGSSDSTQSIANQHSIPFFVQRDGLVGESRNLGLIKTNSPLIKFLDGDDILADSALFDLHAGFQSSHADLVYGQNLNFVDRTESEENQKSFAHTSNPIHTAMVLNSLLTRLSFAKYGLPDQDNYSWNRWLTKAKNSGLNMHKIDELVGHRRIHDSNISHEESAKKELFNLIATNLKQKKTNDV